MAISGKLRLHLYVLDSGVELTLDLKNEKELELAQNHLFRLRGASSSINLNQYVLTKTEYDSLFEALRQADQNRDG